VFGPIPIDGFEIDPKIIEVGREYFEMTMPNLNAIAQDGRWGLDHSDHLYSLICVDAYRPPYIPWHMTTREFFTTAARHLAAEGVLAINVGRAPEDRSLIDALVSTMQTVFPSIHVMDVPGSFNSVIYATLQPTRVENLYVNYSLLDEGQRLPALLKEAMQTTIVSLQPTPQNVGIVYTDDWAPIEWITNRMVLTFLLFGDTQILK
jgi:spermidine synthase